MRRWFTILLLALLPLQSSWAVVGAYCGHETGHESRRESRYASDQQPQHPGHHEHQHADPAMTDPGSPVAEPGSPAGFDFDCSHCHCSCASLPASAVNTARLAPAAQPARLVAGIVRTLAQAPPERPQWLPLA